MTRTWPITVRRARPDDRDTVLAFASATWDGWDYIADVWDEWVADTVGAFLVATAEAGPDGVAPADRHGLWLAPGQVVGITHLAMLSPTEAWVEGIRVDPRVRGMDVATDLQAGVLDAARSCGATMVRYVTSQVNEGSLRLGARHGLLPVGEWRFWGREREDDRVGPEGTAAVAAALDAAAADGLLLPTDAATAAATWFARIASDPTFQAGHGLYEHRSWAHQALTADALTAHIRNGEVLALGPEAGGGWAVLLINRAASLEAGELMAGLLVGDGPTVVRLLDRLGGEPGPLARVRLPDPAPLLAGHEADWLRLGYTPHEGRMIIVEKALG